MQTGRGGGFGRWVRAVFVVLATAWAGGDVIPARGVDYAVRRQVDAWLRHPVLGDPSFDAFERVPGNPVLRGAPPLEWPVNGFLFLDPPGGRRYLYVGEYAEGYLARPSRCRLFAARSDGSGWADLGVVLQGDPAWFDRGGHTPDVSVVYDDGRYHMVYDWGEPDFNAEGGLAYAWAERPEGPWHRAREPITRNSTLPKLLGRYQRTYAATLIRRSADWLIVGMMDAAPNSWAQFVMTAPRPEGPWSERRLVRHVEQDRFHPPLLEFYPAFVHRGVLYAPSTAVARNRNFNVLFRVPLERATEAEAWEIARCGSLWHAAANEAEAFGLWGQTFSGQVDAEGTLWALFPSRDTGGRGTIHVARRPWDQPLRPRGFVLTSHQGPAFTCLHQAYAAFRLETRFTLDGQGAARLFWGHDGALGPDRPQSDAVPHPQVNSRYCAVEVASGHGPARWRVVQVGAPGEVTVHGAGEVAARGDWALGVERSAEGRVTVLDGERVLWSGILPGESADAAGALGWWLEPQAHLAVDRFVVRGRSRPLRLTYLGTEALLGAGENPANWQEQRDDRFRRGMGFVSREEGARAKWNVAGRRFTLWSPRGPRFGRVELRLDGVVAGILDLHEARDVASTPVWTGLARSGSVPGHAVVLRALSGVLPVDVLVAEGP
jgi:hypothetical protein